MGFQPGRFSGAALLAICAHLLPAILLGGVRIHAEASDAAPRRAVALVGREGTRATRPAADAPIEAEPERSAQPPADTSEEIAAAVSRRRPKRRRRPSPVVDAGPAIHEEAGAPVSDGPEATADEYAGSSESMDAAGSTLRLGLGRLASPHVLADAVRERLAELIHSDRRVRRRFQRRFQRMVGQEIMVRVTLGPDGSVRDLDVRDPDDGGGLGPLVAELVAPADLGRFELRRTWSLIGDGGPCATRRIEGLAPSRAASVLGALRRLCGSEDGDRAKNLLLHRIVDRAGRCRYELRGHGETQPAVLDGGCEGESWDRPTVVDVPLRVGSR